MDVYVFVRESKKKIINEHSIFTLTQIGYNSFPEMNSKIALACAFSIGNHHIDGYSGVFINLNTTSSQSADKNEVFKNRTNSIVFNRCHDDFKKISGYPIAYWISSKMREIFYSTAKLGEIAETKQGLATTNNSIFLRLWHEVDFYKIGFNISSTDEAFNSCKKWFPLNKGGSVRRWYENNENIINFENNGKTICDYIDNTPGVNVKSNGRVINRDKYFKEGMTWSSIGIHFSMRYSPIGFIFETKGAMCFPKDNNDLLEILALFNSKLIDHFLLCLSPNLDFHEGPLKLVPTKLERHPMIIKNTLEAIEIAKSDWDSFETSWDFKNHPIVSASIKGTTINEAIHNWQSYSSSSIKRMQELEAENNRLFIESYNLQDELSPEVPEDQITLARADREADMKRLISYAIGCMMGRYSLDQPGLVYANSGNIGFDPTRYQIFPADDDGIVPVMDMDWFPDDAASRFEEFLKVAWSPETLEENLKFVADSLTPKANETPRETIRRYISTQFFKDHLQTYKKRPIYWLFSSGKQRAFECLVYLHRYNEATLSRMRNEYVTPLQGRFTAQADYLTNEVGSASSTAERNRQQKQLDTLKKKQTKLAAFDDLLRHYADSVSALTLMTA